jgi:DNA polymerase delta subunit 1
VCAKYTVANGYSHDSDVVYGDTDSVMVRFGVKTVAEAMTLGREAAKYVSTYFIKPICLDFEKVYYPYLLINKKRYAGMFWNNPDAPDHMDAKGIETVRRDNCGLVRQVIGESLDWILVKRDPLAGAEYVKRIISALLRNELDLSLLVITKAISRSREEYAAKQAHVELAERMRKRDAGSAPVVGDRVPYVVVKAGKGARTYEKAEDPLWVLEHNIPLDTQYYLHQQLAKPLLRIFKPILKDPESLLSGEHTRSLAVQTPTVGGIIGFTRKAIACLGCKAPLDKGGTPLTFFLMPVHDLIAFTCPETTVCRYCADQGREAEVYMDRVAKVNRLERQFASAWTQCQRCQGSFHETVLCSSRDCPIFYMRKKIQKDLGEGQAALARFAASEQLAW